MASDLDGVVSEKPDEAQPQAMVPVHDPRHQMYWMLEEVPNAGNGECLFYSIQHALRNYRGAAVAKLQARCVDILQVSSLDAITVTDLRRAVYCLFLEPWPLTDGILEQWVLMAAEVGLLHEFPQMRRFVGRQISSLTSEDRVTLFKECMKPSTWGDEITLEFLERLLGIRCVVHTGNPGQIQRRTLSYHAEPEYPIVFIVMSLEGNHYQAIEWTDGAGRSWSAFTEEELPDILLRISHRDCATVTIPYVNLQHVPLRYPLPEEVAVKERGSTDQSARDRSVPTTAPEDNVAFMAHFVKCRALAPASSDLIAAVQAEAEAEARARSRFLQTHYPHYNRQHGYGGQQHPYHHYQQYQQQYYHQQHQQEQAHSHTHSHARQYEESKESLETVDMVPADGPLMYAGVLAPGLVPRLQCGVRTRPFSCAPGVSASSSDSASDSASASATDGCPPVLSGRRGLTMWE